MPIFKNTRLCIVAISLLLASGNAFAIVGGKKGPPVTAQQAWYEVVLNCF